LVAEKAEKLVLLQRGIAKRVFACCFWVKV